MKTCASLCAVLTVLTVLTTRAAHAQPAAHPLDRSDDRGAVAWVQQRLDADTAASQRWFWLWLMVPAGSGVVQTAAGAVLAAPGVVDPAVADNWVPGFVVGAVNGYLGVIPQLALPFTPAFAAARLRAASARDDRARHSLAESLLRDCAETEETGRQWWVHLIGAGLALAGAIATAGWMGWGAKPTVGINAWISSGVGLVTSVAISELTIWTQPMDASRAWTEYRSHGTVSVARPRGWSLRPALNGLAVLF